MEKPVTYLIVTAVMAAALVATGAWWFHGKHNPQEPDRYGDKKFALPWWVPATVAGMLIATTAAFSVTVVDARAVGIQTSFGRYSDTLSNGFHLTAPWSSVEEFTTIVQTADLEGDQGVSVTFAGGGSGKVNATFRWQITDSGAANGAHALWEKYRDFENAQRSLVDREGRDAVLNVTNDFTPNDARTKQDVIGSQVKDRLTERLTAYGITVDSVSILSMELDARTQASLDKIVAAQNDVERAKADNERAKIDAETVKLREAAGALSAAANVRYCLDVANSWDVAKNGPLPATFSCGLSGSASVIVGK